MELKKVMSAVLCAALVAGMFSACGASASSEQSSSAKSDVSGSSSVTAPVDIMAKYEEPITLTSVKVTDVARTFTNGNTMEDNEFTRALYDELGIKVEYLWATDITQEQTKMSTMVATGELPDFFYTTDSALASSLMREGFTADITELYETYASDALKSQDVADPEAFASTFVDGRMMGIAGLSYGPINNIMSMWIRNDWLEQSGKEIPKTMNELCELAEVFMEQHPGSYGIAVDKTLTNPSMNTLIPFMNGYGAYSKIWIEKDGQLEYSSIQPEMKVALEHLQDWYKRGIIDKEFSVKDSNKVNEDVVSGRVGIVGGMGWLGWDALGKTVVENPEAYWIPIAVPTGTGEEVTVQSPWPVPGYWLISKDCEHPEAVIKMMNWFMEGELAGRWKDEKFEVESGGVFGGCPITQSTPRVCVEEMLAANAAYEAKNPSGLSVGAQKIYDSTVAWLENQDASQYARYAQYGPGSACELLYNEYVLSERYLVTRLEGADPEGYAISKATLEKLEDDTFTRIIMGESIDSFDKFVSTWKELGGDAATQEVNEMYNR